MGALARSHRPTPRENHCQADAEINFERDQSKHCTTGQFKGQLNPRLSAPSLPARRRLVAA